MISPRILLYIGLGGLAWLAVRHYLNRPKKAPPLIEDQVVPGIDRRGDDAVCAVTITAAEAKAGKSISVPSIEGPQQVDVPPGVADGARLRLAGHGFRREDGRRGDQFVVVTVSGKPS